MKSEVERKIRNVSGGSLNVFRSNAEEYDNERTKFSKPAFLSYASLEWPFTLGGTPSNERKIRNGSEGILLSYSSAIKEKTREFIRLSRINTNLVPTSILIFISGLVTDPENWKRWLFSPVFASAFAMIHLLTTASMVVNDIYDVDIDRINNPDRPIASGKIRPREAMLFFLSLISGYSYLGWNFAPANTRPIWIGSLLLTTIYTPVFKKITLVKNLVCSSIVTMTVPFVGYSIMHITPNLTGNLRWMYFTMKVLFVNSFFIEILLDILDKKGDEIMNVRTLPVIFGEERTLDALLNFLLGSFYLSLFILINNIISATTLPDNYSYFMMICALVITYRPLFNNMIRVYVERNKIRNDNEGFRSIADEYATDYRSRNAIKRASASTGISLFFYFLTYLSYLAGSHFFRKLV